MRVHLYVVNYKQDTLTGEGGKSERRRTGEKESQPSVVFPQGSTNTEEGPSSVVQYCVL